MERCGVMAEEESVECAGRYVRSAAVLIRIGSPSTRRTRSKVVDPEDEGSTE